jgi:hypothetical protein
LATLRVIAVLVFDASLSLAKLNMEHRHLNHGGYTLAAIDDIIGRGGAADWVELHFAALSSSEVRERVVALCERHKDDVYAQRYQFWRVHVQ